MCGARRSDRSKTATMDMTMQPARPFPDTSAMAMPIAADVKLLVTDCSVWSCSASCPAKYSSTTRSPIGLGGLDHHAARDLHLRQLQEEYEADAAQVESASRQAASTLRGTQGRIQDIEAALVHKRNKVIGISDRRQYQALPPVRSLRSRYASP